ncbi:MAG: 4-alpha-glucanotransferase [Thermoguttaceae bacterium]
MMNLNQRFSGVLLPLSSLPGNPCCGGLGAGARRFVDFLAKSGQKAWQMLPVNPTDDCFSPYASISTFAGDSIYIDLDDLVEVGLLTPNEIANLPRGPIRHTAFHVARDTRKSCFHKAFERFKQFSKSGTTTKYHAAFDAFIDRASWIGPHAIFCALCEKFGTNDWSHWPDEAIRRADQSALHIVYSEMEDEIAFHTFLQLVFDVQWSELRNYCHEKQIMLIGDIPIYVSKNSVDTWADPHLFQLDSEGNMTRVAGVPGDSFNPDGQRWNAPLFNWESHRAEDYSWWIHRLRNALNRFDAVRLDHFIGFYNYFSMLPSPDPNDLGEWIPGPASEFFETILREFPDAQLIAEDLGVMNPGVHQLRDQFGFPGINVFQFHFDFRRNTDATSDWKTNSLVCTGTHDTDTLSGWFDAVLEDRKRPEPFWDFPYLLSLIKENMPKDVPVNRNTILWGIVRKVLASSGNVAIFPMQDLLGLPTNARMNFPGRTDGNWTWRLDESLITDELADRLRTWTQEFGR